MAHRPVARPPARLFVAHAVRRACGASGPSRNADEGGPGGRRGDRRRRYRLRPSLPRSSRLLFAARAALGRSRPICRPRLHAGSRQRLRQTRPDEEDGIGMRQRGQSVPVPGVARHYAEPPAAVPGTLSHARIPEVPPGGRRYADFSDMLLLRWGAVPAPEVVGQGIVSNRAVRAAIEGREEALRSEMGQDP